MSRGGHPVLLAVVVTDRLESVRRLFASLEPLREDPDLECLLLDNGTTPIPEDVFADAPLRTRIVRSRSPRSPLAHARREISVAAGDTGGASPVVWMLDDDLSFEALHLRQGWLQRENVARDRIAEARRLARERPDLDLVSGSFTGDPPIRPEATLAVQLSDLRAFVVQASSGSRFLGVRAEPPRFEGDYYYDHAEPGRAGSRDETFPWLPRAPAPWDYADERVAALRAACTLMWGAAPFRPLVEERGEPVVSDTIRRGGNCLLLSRRALLEHPYPTFPVGDGWSRRGDMIGATLFARRRGVAAADQKLSLYHDRTGQRAISAAPDVWAAEFAGVLLARLILDRNPEHRWEADVPALAAARLDRVLTQLALATRRSDEVVVGLERLSKAGGLDSVARAEVMNLLGSLSRLRATLESLEPRSLRQALVDPPLHEAIRTAGRRLLEEERKCAGS